MDTLPPDTCRLYLWQNRNTVVIGQNQNAWQECKVKELEEDGGFLARRLSGGGAVFHDLGNLNFTFLVPRADYDVGRQTEVILRAVGSYGLEVERSGRNDILVQGRKFSGNAFYKHGQNAYHHGTLLINVDMSRLSRYLNVAPDKLKSKGVRSVVSRVANLQEFCPEITVENMKGRLIQAFGSVYGSEPVEIGPGSLDAGRIGDLSVRNASWEWRLGRRLAFDHEISDRFSWGNVTIQLSVDGGIVRQAEVFSDAMDSAYISAMPGILKGKPYSSRDLAVALESLAPADIGELGYEMDAQMAKDIQSLIEAQDF